MRSFWRAALVLCWFCLCALVARGAAASEEASAAEAPDGVGRGADGVGRGAVAVRVLQAEELVKQGIEWRKRGDDRRALEAFERALSLDDSAQGLAQLALAEQALGRWREADRHLELALARSTDPWIAANRITLEQAREEIASRLGSLEITCNVQGAEIQLDGQIAGHTPLSGPLRWVAGESIMRVSAPGYFDVTRRVKVDAGSLARVDVVLTSTSDAAPELERPPQPSSAGSVEIPPPPPQPAAVPIATGGERTSSTRDILTYASLGVAGVGVIVGATGYVIRETNAKAYNDDRGCDLRMDVPRSVECAGEARAVRRGEALAIAGFSATGAFGLAALVMWLGRPEADADARLACGVGGLSIGCSAQF